QRGRLMQDEPWYAQRRRELEAAAPVKRKRIEPFVKVPLWWITAATKATNNHKALVCIELLYASWKAKSLTFPLPNARLQKRGITRETMRLSLLGLVSPGLIIVELPSQHTPIVPLF